MDTDKKLDTSEAGPSGLAAPKSASRRRLLRAGVGAAPVVLTMASLPVQATPVFTSCRTASAFASITANPLTSGASAKFSTCTGNSVSTWITSCNQTKDTKGNPVYTGWGSTPNASFPSCLDASLASSSYCNGKGTLYSALTDGAVTGLAPTLAAVYLNFTTGAAKEPYVKLSQLKDIWNAFSSGSPTATWSPVSGMSWDWTATRLWMTSTGILGP